MQAQHQHTAIVIGAGIVGLASARALAQKGFKVTVYERYPQAVGASIRNFGMVWPVGQPAGEAYETATRSRDIWKEIAAKAGFWSEQSGSLHLAYTQVELAVMEEFAAAYAPTRPCALYTAEQALAKSPAVCPDGLLGALWSADEVIVDPREAIPQVARFLEEQHGVSFRWNTAVTGIEKNRVHTGSKLSQEADLIIVCSGADFETLYPEVFRQVPVTKCKLQMMRLAAQAKGWRIGPSLCGGLSALHYHSFKAAPSLALLKQETEERWPQYGPLGIHVMVSQNGRGELTIGDSHEYGLHHDPFDRQEINDLIMSYLKRFASFKDWTPIQSWNGIYAKMTNGQDHLLTSPEPGVWILNATSGAGMTLSFGLAERMVKKMV